jgi:hypothetical protein
MDRWNDDRYPDGGQDRRQMSVPAQHPRQYKTIDFVRRHDTELAAQAVDLEPFSGTD